MSMRAPPRIVSDALRGTGRAAAAAQAAALSLSGRGSSPPNPLGELLEYAAQAVDETGATGATARTSNSTSRGSPISSCTSILRFVCRLSMSDGKRSASVFVQSYFPTRHAISTKSSFCCRRGRTPPGTNARRSRRA
jgi:hypothetical protein